MIKHVLRLGIAFAFLLTMNMSAWSQEAEETQYAYQTFRDTRIVNGHSTETGMSGEMKFIIQHRFGEISGGAYELWGLDQSSIRFGLDYALNGWTDIGFGRSSFGKYYDFYIKQKLLSQSSGAKNMPVNMSYFLNAGINSTRWDFPDRENRFVWRMTYVGQVLLSRKFSPGFSLQLMPTFVHRNLVETRADNNDILALGTASRIQLTKVVAVQLEYYYVFPYQLGDTYRNSLSVGFEFQTRGHVFQVHLSNSPTMVENLFITETEGSWQDGNIRLGFNITRDFKLRGRKMKS